MRRHGASSLKVGRLKDRHGSVDMSTIARVIHNYNTVRTALLLFVFCFCFVFPPPPFFKADVHNSDDVVLCRSTDSNFQCLWWQRCWTFVTQVMATSTSSSFRNNCSCASSFFASKGTVQGIGPDLMSNVWASCRAPTEQAELEWIWSSTYLSKGM